ncbi:transposase [Micromonospora sp. NPDC005173]|uniref:transposase n=1 Tax=Micromonospora sp. NPDC005173 TaxID=3157165 RepID=UPI0033AA898A
MGRGCSLATRITPGQAADTWQLIPLLHQVWAPRPGGVGRPRMRPDSVTGDMAYSSRANRRALRNKGITTVIPEPNDQIANQNRRGRRGGHPPTFDTTAYKRRNQVSNAASTDANTGAASPPGTTNSPPISRQLSTWSKPSIGYAPSPTNMIYETELAGSRPP